MADPLRSMLEANPNMMGGGLPSAPAPGSGYRLSTVRAQTPGGELMSYVPSEGALWFEQMYRTLPPSGMYQATPNRPLTFVLGAFQVPKSMVLVVIDYSFDIYRFLGAAADDYIPVETNRLSTQVGWDINVGNSRPGNLKFNIIPKEQSQAQQSFPSTANVGQPASQYLFDNVRASAQQNAVGPGLSLLPQRHRRDGNVPLSNTYVAKSTDVLTVSCSVLNRVPIPIAFFEADICGVLLPQNVYDEYQNAAVPVGNPIARHLPGAP